MGLNIHEILLDIRKSHKLSRKKLSNISGFKEPTIVGYEKGLRKPSDKYIRFISLYFNVSEEYIRGLEDEKKEYIPIHRIILMYKDIYNFKDDEMVDLFDAKNNDDSAFFLDYVEIMKTLAHYKEDISSMDKLLICEVLNIKPSFFDFAKISKEFFKRLKIQEKNGILFNQDYYVSVIKNRNLAKDNYTPPKEIKEIPKKYQDILNLLPYASDKFLNDIHEKLKTMKNIQSL